MWDHRNCNHKYWYRPVFLSYPHMQRRIHSAGAETETLCEDKDGRQANTSSPNLIIITIGINHSRSKYEFVLARISTDKLKPFNWAGVLRMSNELKTFPRFDFPLAWWSEEGHKHHAIPPDWYYRGHVINIRSTGSQGWTCFEQNLSDVMTGILLWERVLHGKYYLLKWNSSFVLVYDTPLPLTTPPTHCVWVCVWVWFPVWHTLQAVLLEKIYDGGCLAFLSLQGRKSCEICVSNKRDQHVMFEQRKHATLRTETDGLGRVTREWKAALQYRALWEKVVLGDGVCVILGTEMVLCYILSMKECMEYKSH